MKENQHSVSSELFTIRRSSWNLFVALAEKSLSNEHKTTIEVLEDDHMKGRELVKKTENGLDVYAGDSAEGVRILTEGLEGLLELYPQHIEKEDKHFFFPVMDHFTR